MRHLNSVQVTQETFSHPTTCSRLCVPFPRPLYNDLWNCTQSAHFVKWAITYFRNLFPSSQYLLLVLLLLLLLRLTAKDWQEPSDPMNRPEERRGRRLERWRIKNARKLVKKFTEKFSPSLQMATPLSSITCLGSRWGSQLFVLVKRTFGHKLRFQSSDRSNFGLKENSPEEWVYIQAVAAGAESADSQLGLAGSSCWSQKGRNQTFERS